MKNLIFIAVLCVNTLIVLLLFDGAFGPSDGPEGPEAAGRGPLAILLIPFALFELLLLAWASIKITN